MGITTENADRAVVCMECGERFATIAESMGHPHMQSEFFERTGEGE